MSKIGGGAFHIFKSFSDANLEAQYNDWLFENTKSLTVRTGIVATTIFALFFILDSIIVGEFLWPSFIFRILIAIPFLGIGISRFKKVKSQNSFDNILSFLEVSTHLMVLVLSYISSFPIYYIALLATVFMFLMSMTIGVREKRQFINLIIVSILSILYILFLHSITPSFFESITYTSIIIINLIIAIFANSLLASQNRDIFLKILKLENQKEVIEGHKNQLSYINKMLAHDLKTPIRNISSFVTLLERKLPELEPDQNEIFSFVKTNASKMSNLVEDFLEFAKLQDGYFHEYEFIDLNEHLPHYTKAFNDENPHDNIEINLMGKFPNLFISNNILNSLLSNLITNAIKYNTNDVKKISISATQSGYYNILHIKDNGIGVPERYHEKVFKIFERLNPSDYQDGTGIGLAHCAEIMRRLNGKITLSSALDQGSTFSLYFPMKSTEQVSN